MQLQRQRFTRHASWAAVKLSQRYGRKRTCNLINKMETWSTFIVGLPHLFVIMFVGGYPIKFQKIISSHAYNLSIGFASKNYLQKRLSARNTWIEPRTTNLNFIESIILLMGIPNAWIVTFPKMLGIIILELIINQPSLINCIHLYPHIVDITHVNSSLMSTLIWISSNVEITDAKQLVILISKSLCTEIVQW